MGEATKFPRTTGGCPRPVRGLAERSRRNPPRPAGLAMTGMTFTIRAIASPHSHCEKWLPLRDTGPHPDLSRPGGARSIPLSGLVHLTGPTYRARKASGGTRRRNLSGDTECRHAGRQGRSKRPPAAATAANSMSSRSGSAITKSQNRESVQCCDSRPSVVGVLCIVIITRVLHGLRAQASIAGRSPEPALMLILRGLARSATGIRNVSTPAS